jgi:hypothetical protein
MTRTLKVSVLVFAFIAWLLLSQTLYAGHGMDPAMAGVFDAATLSVGTPWTPRVTIMSSALAELRDRMARYKYRTGICITGPYEQDCRAPADLEEAWLLDKLYGRAPRWVLEVIPLEDLSRLSLEPGEMLWVGEVSGVRVGIHTTKTVSHLNI